MDQQYLLVILTIFVAAAAVAMVFQAAMLFGIYKSSRSMDEKARRVLPKVEALLDVSRATIEESRRQIGDIAAKTTGILDTTRRQLDRVDDVMQDATVRAHAQLERAEIALDHAISRAQETVTFVQSGVMKPLREIQGVALGLKTAIQYIVRGGRTDPTEATADEEMFI